MALILHNSNTDRPLGQFDAQDGVTFKGGEVVTWASVTAQASSGTDLAAADVNNDGYSFNSAGSTKTRPAVNLATLGTSAPLFLSDDGTASYGTLLGSVVGSTAGQVVTGGAVLGPASYAGSGKVTLYGTHGGLFGTTLDNTDSAANGLQPGTTAASFGVGSPLSYTSTGLLTPSTGGNKVSSAPIVAYFASFETNGSVVTTPSTLVSALNSPSGNVSNLLVNKFTQAVYWWIGL